MSRETLEEAVRRLADGMTENAKRLGFTPPTSFQMRPWAESMEPLRPNHVCTSACFGGGHVFEYPMKSMPKLPEPTPAEMRAFELISGVAWSNSPLPDPELSELIGLRL